MSNIGQFTPLIIGILGVSGIIFTALRFRRDDTTAIVHQQDTLLMEMRALNDELRTTSGTLRIERDDLRIEVGRLSGEVDALRRQRGP